MCADEIRHRLGNFFLGAYATQGVKRGHALQPRQGRIVIKQAGTLIDFGKYRARQYAIDADFLLTQLRCHDFARADFRLDAAGEPRFLEVNPLPTFAPDGSFAILAELMGRRFEDLLAEVLTLGLERLGLA